MIVLRKIRPSSNIVIGEPLIGLLNGDNQVFSTSNNYKEGKIMISYNGQVLHSPEDFIELNTTQIQFKYIKPHPEAIIKSTYEKGV